MDNSVYLNLNSDKKLTGRTDRVTLCVTEYFARSLEVI